jgi:hypothetical protein
MTRDRRRQSSRCIILFFRLVVCGFVFKTVLCRYATGRDADRVAFRPLKGPRTVAEARARSRPDVVISAHQENYMDLNAGLYFVRGNDRTRKLFQVSSSRFSLPGLLFQVSSSRFDRTRGP